MNNINELRPLVTDLQPERTSSSVQKKSVLEINGIRIQKMETERRIKAVKHAKLMEGKRHAHTLDLINKGLLDELGLVY